MSHTTTAYHYPFLENLETFAEDAAFLWLLREIALKQPHYFPEDLCELEHRIDDHLKGLLLQPEPAWRVAKSQLELQEPGEVFVATFVAFKSLEANRIQHVLDRSLDTPTLVRAFVSALLWLPSDISEPWVERFLLSKDLRHKTIAIQIKRLQREDPGDYLIGLLRRDDCIEQESLHAECLRLIGECKLHSLVPALNVAMNSDLPEVAFWSLWSAVLLGNKALLAELYTYIETSSSFQEPALQLYFRCADQQALKQKIRTLASNPDTVRLAIKAAGIYGDPEAVPWLISCMDNPKLARLAGETFSLITGIDLEVHKLDFELPDIHPEAEENEDLTFDEDENLPWPDLNKLKALWQKHRKQYGVGVRLFLGKPPSVSDLKPTLSSGRQRHRISAGYELALIQNLSPMQNIKSRALIK